MRRPYSQSTYYNFRINATYEGTHTSRHSQMYTYIPLNQPHMLHHANENWNKIEFLSTALSLSPCVNVALNSHIFTHSAHAVLGYGQSEKSEKINKTTTHLLENRIWMHIGWHRPTISFSFVFIHVSVILFSAYEGGRMTATTRINEKLKKKKTKPNEVNSLNFHWYTQRRVICRCRANSIENSAIEFFFVRFVRSLCSRNDTYIWHLI